jgi:hypothetical protein
MSAAILDLRVYTSSASACDAVTAFPCAPPSENSSTRGTPICEWKQIVDSYAGKWMMTADIGAAARRPGPARTSRGERDATGENSTFRASPAR